MSYSVNSKTTYNVHSPVKPVNKMKLRLNIERIHITEGARFKTEKGIVWIIDEIDAKGIVRTSMEHGSKGNYRDDIQTVIAFLNEEKATKVNN